MAYKTVPFEKRIKDNIKNYAPDKLFPVENLTEYFKAFTKACGVEILLTDRHGERLISTGDFSNFNGDVVANPGRKVRVCDRTVGHLYCRFDDVEDSGKVIFDLMLDDLTERIGGEVERIGDHVRIGSQ